MHERFTDRSRKIMILANQEAQRLSHDYIGAEHLLLGIVKQEAGSAIDILKKFDIDRYEVRLEIEKQVEKGTAELAGDRIPQTPQAKKVIEFAIKEARLLEHNYVGTEHFLLGLIREKSGLASKILNKVGLDLDDVRAASKNQI